MTEATYLPSGMPIPRAESDGLSAPYWEAVQRDVLVVQRCKQCAGWQWGPEWICHRCHSFDLGWKEVEPKGRIYSWERSHHPVHAALREACPYISVLVELPHADNIRMLGNLLGDPLQEVRVGAEVEAVFEHHRDIEPPFSLVQWRYI
jgi:uncharacterized OB-fold protein